MTAAGFNPHYLSDALSALDSPYVNFAFTAPGKPCLLTGIDEIDGEREAGLPARDHAHAPARVSMAGRPSVAESCSSTQLSLADFRVLCTGPRSPSSPG